MSTKPCARHASHLYCEAFKVGITQCCYAGNESHAGQVFTGVAALAIADGLQHVDTDLLSWW